jgi:hypothetical protein
MLVRNTQRPLYAILFAFGVWLFVAPWWMPGYEASTGFAIVHAHALGLLTALCGAVAMLRATRWTFAAAIALNIWMLISPFAIGFIGTAPGPAWNQMLVGVLLACAMVAVGGGRAHDAPDREAPRGDADHAHV